MDALIKGKASVRSVTTAGAILIVLSP